MVARTRSQASASDARGIASTPRPARAALAPTTARKRRSRENNSSCDDTIAAKAKHDAKAATRLIPASNEHGANTRSVSDQMDQIRSTMFTLLSALHSATSTICPSQVARKLHERDPRAYPDWRALMDPVRHEVWAWVEDGRAEVTQGGVVRTLEEREGIKGPIRVRRGPTFSET